MFSLRKPETLQSKILIQFTKSMQRSPLSFRCVQRYWMRRHFRSEGSGFQRPAGGNFSASAGGTESSRSAKRGQTLYAGSSVAPAPAGCKGPRPPDCPGALAQDKKRCDIFLICLGKHLNPSAGAAFSGGTPPEGQSPKDGNFFLL